MPLLTDGMCATHAHARSTFHFFEQYRGREGFEAHRRTPHFVAWEKFASTEPFTAPPLVTFYKQNGDAPAASPLEVLVDATVEGIEDNLAALKAPVLSAARTAASLGGIVAVDVTLRRLFLMHAIPFPSSLAGMLGLFGALCTMQAFRPAAATRLVAAAAPGCAFISR